MATAPSPTYRVASGQQVNAGRWPGGRVSGGFTLADLVMGGSFIGYTAPPATSADWVARSTGAGVVWAHNFENDTEVTAHLLTNATLDSAKARRVIDSTGIGCLEQISLGSTLAVNYTAGSPTLQITDPTYWPDPAVVGTYQVVVCDPPPTVGRKNLLNVTAKSGNVLTVNLEPLAGSAFVIVGGGSFAQIAQSYTTGAIIGAEASDWRRTFAALPAGENGKPTDDSGASGAVPLRSKLSGNAYSVPRDLSLWQYGWYGHPNNQTTWADWTGWQGASPLTPRGVSQGAAAKFRLWDGDEFYIQWRQKVDPRFYANHAQPDPNGETEYWGRKAWAIQSELSSVNQIVAGVATSNRYGIPSTTKAPFGLSTYKAARVIGVSDYPGRVGPSQQKGSPWDVAPHYALLTSSFKPSTGLATPDGSTAWELPDSEWVTFYMRVKPGRSDVAETEIEVKFARTEDPAYTGTYTTLLSVTDARIVYSGSGDYDFPDGVFSYPTVPVMNALPGFQSFGIMGYFNITQSVGIPPPKASYYIRLAQVIFSKAAIPPPVSDALPTWVPSAGRVATLTVANGKLTNSFASQVASPYSSFFSAKIVNDYSGSVLNPHFGNYGAVVFEGSGHSASNDNSVIQLELGATSATFRRVADPTTTGGISDTTIPAMTDLWGEYSADGKPGSRHSYGAQDVVGPADGGAAYGTFWRVISNSVGYPGYNAGETPHKLEFTATTGTMAYARGGTARNSGNAVSLNISGAPCWTAHVPAQDRIYIETAGGSSAYAVRWFDLITGTYVNGSGTQRDVSLMNTTDGGIMFHVASRNLLIFMARDGSGNLGILTMDVSASQPSWVNTLRSLSQPIAVTASWSAACWCEDNTRIIVGNVNGDANCVFEIEIPVSLGSTWTATRKPFTGGDTINWAPSTTYKKWSYNSRTKSIVYMPYASTAGTDTVYVYRPENT